MKLKICGIRRSEDISYLNETPPDYIGFVFAKSRRQVTPKEAAILSSALNPQIKTVGVFVNEPIASVLQTAQTAGLSVLQLHGDETEEYIRTLRNHTTCQIWKAIRVKDSHSLTKAGRLPVDTLLLDAFSASAYGGTGKIADWSLIQKANVQKPFFLAGGLTAENLPEAIACTHPAGIDLSGGVETNGVKDREKIQKVVDMIHLFSAQEEQL